MWRQACLNVSYSYAQRLSPEDSFSVESKPRNTLNNKPNPPYATQKNKITEQGSLGDRRKGYVNMESLDMKMFLHLWHVVLSGDSSKSLFSRLVGDGKALFSSFFSSESYSSCALFVTWKEHSLVSHSAQEMMGNQIYNAPSPRFLWSLAFFYGSSSEHNRATRHRTLRPGRVLCWCESSKIAENETK